MSDLGWLPKESCQNLCCQWKVLFVFLQVIFKVNNGFDAFMTNCELISKQVIGIEQWRTVCSQLFHACTIELELSQLLLQSRYFLLISLCLARLHHTSSLTSSLLLSVISHKTDTCKCYWRFTWLTVKSDYTSCQNCSILNWKTTTARLNGASSTQRVITHALNAPQPTLARGR